MLIPEHYRDMDWREMCDVGNENVISLIAHGHECSPHTIHHALKLKARQKHFIGWGITNQTFKKEASLIVARIASRAFKSISRLMPNFAHLAFLP